MSAPWAEGYVADLNYPHTYVADLLPQRMQLPFLAAGLAAPEVRHACELGFGQGLSVNIHAAASQVQWHGTDFLPDHALAARELAQASGAAAALTDEAFADFCARTDLPDFDFIGLHGVWSWISDANRAVLTDFIRRKLRVGGAVYFGYNTQPGWSAMVPVRDLAMQHVQRVGGAGQGLAGRIQGALGFLDTLVAASPAFMVANPAIADALAKLKAQDTDYLAHEYFNSSWRPMSFADMADALAPAKLRFACSAHHEVERIHLTPAQQTLLQGVADPVFRESVRDFCVNQRFRKDYWVKGARRLSLAEQSRQLRAMRLVLTSPRAAVPSGLNTQQGEFLFDSPALVGLLDALGDHRPRSLGELAGQLAGRGVQLPQLLEAVMLLVSVGSVVLAQSDEAIAAAKAATDRLNLHLLVKALGSDEVQYLASPVTGGGIGLNRVEQLFLYAALDPSRKSEDLPALVWQVLKPLGVKMLRQNQPVEGDADNLAELTRLAGEFMRLRLPALRALGVVPNASRNLT